MKWWRASLLAFAVTATGCRKEKKEAPTSSALDAGGSDAGPPADVPFALVAEGPKSVFVTSTKDGKVVVASGGLVYEGKPDGTLVPLLGEAEQRVLIPDEDIVVGYPVARRISGFDVMPGGGHLIRTDGEDHMAEFFELRAGKLTPIPVGFPTFTLVPFREHLVGFDMENGGLHWAGGADIPPPKMFEPIDIEPARIHAGPDGSLFAFAGWRDERIVMWRRDGELPVNVLLPDGQKECYPLRSMAPGYHLRCGSAAYVFAGDHFERIFHRSDVFLESESTIGSDGSLHIASSRKVERCPPKSACLTRALPETPIHRAPTYESWATEYMKPGTRLSWQMLAVVTATPHTSHFGEVTSLVARGPNDVWAVVNRGERRQVFHTSALPAEPKFLPSTADARIALRNTRPPARWTGTCEQVYVRLGTDGEAIAKRETEIRAALHTSDAPGYFGAFTWALVEGKLGDERGAGIVLARSSPEQKLKPMETAAQNLVKAFATGPANEPPVYCTLPVLERVVLPRSE
jgi:hypothetical protein